MPSTETLIIGAGPAGLAVAGRLGALGRPFIVLEQADALAPAWRAHYDRLHLHTVKQYSHLPHKPFPSDYPTYVPRLDLISYFDDYARQMGIQPVFFQKVTHTSRESGQWVTSTESGENYTSEFLVVATGFNRRPHLPKWPGMEDFKGEMFHSKFYKNGAPYRGKDVLVVGMGNSGAEIALCLWEHGARPALSVRGPVNVVKRDVFGRPTQTTAMLLAKLPVPLADWIGKQVSRLTVGDLRPYGIHRPDMAPMAQLRKFAQTPVMDIGTIDRIKSGEIRVFPAIDHFDESGVHFTDGRYQPFQAIVLATGYQSAVEEFMPGVAPALNAHGHPAALWNDALPGAYFVGFDAYSSGILNSIHRDSGKVTDHLVQQLSRAANPATA